MLFKFYSITEILVKSSFEPSFLSDQGSKLNRLRSTEAKFMFSVARAINRA